MEKGSGSGDIQVEKCFSNEDHSLELYNCSSIDSIDKFSLNSFTESLLQLSLCVGLFIELSLIFIIISFIYKYGFENSYLMLKKKFQEIKKPEGFSLLNFFLLCMFIWVATIDSCLVALKDHSLDQSTHIRALHPYFRITKFCLINNFIYERCL